MKKGIAKVLFDGTTIANGAAQVEKATVAGTITGAGNATVTVTANGMANSPKAVTVPLVAGTAQVEKLTVTTGATVGGNTTVSVTAAGMTGSPKAVTVAVAGTKQQESIIVTGDATTGGDATITVTAAGMTGSPQGVTVALVGGTAQVETATVTQGVTSNGGNISAVVTAAGMSGSPKSVTVAVAGTKQVLSVPIIAGCSTSGDNTLTITAAGMSNSPKSVVVAVVGLEDSGEDVAQKFRLALAADADVGAFFDIGGEDANIVLTAKTPAANDATMKFELAGTTGVAIGSYEISTQGVAPDSAATVAGKIRTALGADETVSGFFTISGSGAEVILTAKSPVANDDTMALAVTGTTGVTVSSANTTAGVAGDPINTVATKIRTALAADTNVGAFFDVGGTGATILLTAKACAANDATMAMALTGDTGVTVGSSTNAVAGVAADTANGVAGKIRTALGADTDIAAFFTISGANAEVILTAKAKAANDATMAIALAGGTTGAAAGASENTTAGVATDTAALAAGKIRAGLAADADVGAFFTVSGTGAEVILTAKTVAANDTTMNIAVANGTCTGLTQDLTSDAVTAGDPTVSVDYAMGQEYNALLVQHVMSDQTSGAYVSLQIKSLGSDLCPHHGKGTNIPTADETTSYSCVYEALPNIVKLTLNITDGTHTVTVLPLSL